MLELLAKNDTKYRQYALGITKDKMQADDLVNDMYIKLHDITPREIKSGYIYRILKNMYLDQKRKEKTFKPIPLSFINTHKETFIADSDDCNNNELLTLFREELLTIGYIDRELAIEGTYSSTRELADKYEINNVKVWRKQKAAKDKLKKSFKSTYDKYTNK